MNSDIFSKKGLLEILANNKQYAACLAALKNDEERRKVKAFTEDIFLNVFNGVFSVNKSIESKKENEKSEDIPKQEDAPKE